MVVEDVQLRFKHYGQHPRHRPHCKQEDSGLPLAAVGQALPIPALLTHFQGEAFTTYD